MRRTRIVATIGPASCDEDSLRTMIQAGLDVARLNYSHGDDEWRAEVAERIRRIANEHGIHIGIMADLPGPKLRLGRFEGTYQLSQGEIVSLRCGETEGYADSSSLPVEYEGLAQEIRPGDPVLLSDGLIQLEVEECNENIVKCRIIEGGPITQRKGINVPGTIVKLPAVGPRDEEALRHAIGLDVEFIAVSYVRSEEDVSPARRILEECNSKAWIVSKIEHPSALESLDGIIEVSDAVMVARGDLGVELPAHKVPVLQKKIVNKCRFASKPCIIATQMLESMTHNFSATRAEINDVSNSVFDGADALMLSGETSIGIQPLKVVDTMRKTIKDAEKSMEDFDFKKIKGRVSTKRKVADNICKNAVKAANDLNAKAIISATYSGYSALKVSSYRPKAFIYAFTNNHSILNTMSIFWGVVGVYYDRGSTTDQLVQETIEVLQKNKIVKKGELVINTVSMPAKERGGTNALKITKV